MNENMSVKFWGVRGSYPTPGQHTVHFGGNTACVEIRAGEYTIILDAGTGIIPLGRDLARRAREQGKPVKAVILFSHLHHDHTQGFPYFAPAYQPMTQLSLFGPGDSEQALEELLARNQMPPAFPVSLREMNSTKEIRCLCDTSVLMLEENGARIGRIGESAANNGVTIRLLRSYAHPGGTYIYRVEWQGQSVVYATDTEGYVGTDRRLANFARNADLLIHDAQYSEAHYRGQDGYFATQGFGHSTPQMAAELAIAAQARNLALFHHDPTYSDEMVQEQEKQAQVFFPTAFAAREGLEISLGDQPLPFLLPNQAVTRANL